MNILRFLRFVVALGCATSLQALAIQGVSWNNLTRGGTAVTSPLFVGAGDVVKLDVSLTANGASNPPGTSGLGVCIEYQRSAVGDPLVANLFQTDLTANGSPQPLDTDCQLAGSTDTVGADYTVIKGWARLSSGGWPNLALPVKLYDAQFTVPSAPAVLTRIGFGASSLAANETFLKPADIVLCGKPTVTVVKTADGAETGAAAARFDVKMSIPVAAACVAGTSFPVSLSLSGTATIPGQPNADYAIGGTNVTAAGSAVTINFPADGTTLTRTVIATPVDDPLAETSETVILQLNGGSGNYVIGAASTATASLVDNDSMPLTLTNASVPDGVVGSAYATQMFSTTGGVGPYSFALGSGALPPGLALTAAGALSGTPIAAGTFDFSVAVTDSTAPGAGGPQSASKAYRIVVAKGTQTITFGAIADRALYSAPLTVSASATSGLPVSFSVTGTCTLSGTTVTPSAVGSCTVRASQLGNVNWNLAPNVDRTFNVLPPTISISPSTLPQGVVDIAYGSPSPVSITASGGSGPYSFVVGTGTLPSGLALSGAGALTGTPTAPGTFNFSVTATDASGAAAGGPFSANRSYAILVCGRPVVTVVKAADGAEAASAPAQFDVALSLAVPAACATGGAFPVSLSLSGSATIPGQPNADYAISGTNVTSAGATVSVNFPADGMSLTRRVTATPVDDTLLEGTETIVLQITTGSGNYTIGAAATATANIADNDLVPLALTNATVPNGVVGTAYATQMFAAAGGVGPYSFAAGNGAVPPGLTLTAAGVLSGTPIAAGTFDFDVTVTDSTPPSSGGPTLASKAYRIVVAKGTQTITFGAIADRALHSAPLTLSATSTSSLPVSFSVSGHCTLSGTTTVTPTATGTCTVRASQLGNVNWTFAPNVERTFNVLPPAIVLSPATLPGALLNVAYGTPATVAVEASGGIGPYAFAVTGGSLPPGLSLSNAGVLTGNPTMLGTFNFTVTATDASAAAVGGPFTSSKSYTIQVSVPVAIVTLSSNFNPSARGQTVVLTVNVAGGGVIPTGVVTIVEGATTLCGPLPLASGLGRTNCVANFSTVGAHLLKVNYSGDSKYPPATSAVFTQDVVNAGSRMLQVTRAGAGSGTVGSVPAGIDCGNTCSQPYASDSSVTLFAAPSPGSMFLGWLGACGGKGSCNVTVAASTSVSAVFAPASMEVEVDVDDNGRYDALTDGILAIRYMFGLKGQALVSGAVSGNAGRSSPGPILARLDELLPVLDVDADGRVDALTDGIVLIRYLFGLRGESLISGATGPGARRTTAAQVEAYLQSLMP